MRTRLIIVGVSVLVLSMIVALGYRRHSHRVEAAAALPVIEPAAVQTFELQRTDHPIEQTFFGLLQARRRVELALQIPGRISELAQIQDRDLQQGDAVTKGQVLARLEPLRHQVRVEQAQARIKQTQAQMAAARAAMASAQARLDDAKLEQDRILQLHQRNAAPKRELDKANLAVRYAEADIAAAKAQLADADAQYDAARAQAAMAQVHQDDAVLKAPFDGQIAVRHVQVGDMVQPGRPIVTLVDLSQVKLVLGVAERKLPLLKQGQAVTVRIAALEHASKLAQASEREHASKKDSVGRGHLASTSASPENAQPTQQALHKTRATDSADGRDAIPGQGDARTDHVSDASGQSGAVKRDELATRTLRRHRKLNRHTPVVGADAAIVDAIASEQRRERGALGPAWREALVSVVPPAADPATGLFHVEVSLRNPSGLLRPGMVGQAIVQVGKVDAFVMPAQSVTVTDGKVLAWMVQREHRAGVDLSPLGRTVIDVPYPVARRVVFEPLLIEHDRILVAALPDAMDLLIVRGQNHLKDNQPVRLVPDAPDASRDDWLIDGMLPKRSGTGAGSAGSDLAASLTHDQGAAPRGSGPGSIAPPAGGDSGQASPVNAVPATASSGHAAPAGTPGSSGPAASAVSDEGGHDAVFD